MTRYYDDNLFLINYSCKYKAKEFSYINPQIQISDEFNKMEIDYMKGLNSQVNFINHVMAFSKGYYNPRSKNALLLCMLTKQPLKKWEEYHSFITTTSYKKSLEKLGIEESDINFIIKKVFRKKKQYIIDELNKKNGL